MLIPPPPKEGGGERTIIVKKIINKKLYDTKTATYIAGYEYGTPRDLAYVSEDLYQKKNGELFLHAEGGPKSEYCKYSSENSWGGGEEIIPESMFNAKKWVEEHCDADVYIKLFGEVEE